MTFNSNLSKEEAAALFHKGESRLLPGLGDFMRTVDIKSPWADVNVRVHIRYASATPGEVGLFASGKFLG